MIVHAFRCETCKKEHDFYPDGLRAEYTQVPADWIMTVVAGIMHHFCCEKCLAKSLGVQPQESTEAPASKMRRFLLIDGETADEFDGVQFSSGRVSVDVGGGDYAPLNFRDWDHLKNSNAGSGVTWIDQEVCDAN